MQCRVSGFSRYFEFEAFEDDACVRSDVRFLINASTVLLVPQHNRTSLSHRSPRGSARLTSTARCNRPGMLYCQDLEDYRKSWRDGWHRQRQSEQCGVFRAESDLHQLAAPLRTPWLDIIR
jgi:hypothetical protein